MNTFKLCISYKGTQYFGWQVQPDQPTVQGELHKALEKLCAGKEFKTLGSGRTDAGVHALEQICKVSTEMAIEPSSMLKALNTFLPDDIKVMEASLVEESFMPTIDAKKKKYVYLFSNQSHISPLASSYIANNSFELNENIMRDACKLFVGEHDFHNFQTVGTEVKSTIREIYSCHLESVSGNEFFPEHFKVSIEGNGFLKQMVRLIIGAIWSAGRGKFTLAEIENALSTDNKVRVGAVAPPEGLYLASVTY